MKKRILGLILVVVMLTLSLVSCGYSYKEDDLSKYATFDKAAFEAALAALEIENGEFLEDEEKRNELVMDSIYEALVGKVDKEDKTTDGILAEHDKLYFCYYATAVVEGVEHVFYASTMKESAAVNVQFGLSDTEGFYKEVEKAFVNKDITDMIYKTTSSGKATAGKTAYVSYVVEYDTVTSTGATAVEKITVTNERVVLGDTTNVVAEKLVDSTIGSSIANFTTGSKETGDLKSYSSVKVNWVVDEGTYVQIDYTPFDTSTKLTNTHGKKDIEVKDVEFSYYVYPVYYLDVEDFNADSIMKLLLSSFTKADEEDAEKTVGYIPSFTGKDDILKAITDLKSALTTAESEYDKKVSEEKTASDALDTAKKAGGENPTDAQKETITKAEQSLETAKANTATAKKSVDDAEVNLANKLNELYGTVSQETIVEEYKKTVYDDLLDKYNTEIKNNLAKAIWDAAKAASNVTEAPRAAVQQVYDKLIESHTYTFHTGTYDSSASVSNWNQYKGNFRAYLIAVTGGKDYQNAKEEVWQDAIDYVKPIVTIYYVAEQYGVEITDEDFKEFKEDEESSYSYYEHYYGDEDVLVAIQFDKLMNHFLESETDENGKVTYKKITFTFHDHDHD